MFRSANVEVNTEPYLDILSCQIKSWIEAYYTDGNSLSSEHTSKKTQVWLKAYWPKEMWPLRSPDLSPLEYSVWAVTVKKEACSASSASVQALKASIRKTWQKNDIRLHSTCRTFLTLETLISAEGGHIEK